MRIYLIPPILLEGCISSMEGYVHLMEDGDEHPCRTGNVTDEGAFFGVYHFDIITRFPLFSFLCTIVPLKTEYHPGFA